MYACCWIGLFKLGTSTGSSTRMINFIWYSKPQIDGLSGQEKLVQQRHELTTDYAEGRTFVVFVWGGSNFRLRDFASMSLVSGILLRRAPAL